MHFVFSLLIVSQIYTFQHQIEHLTDYTEVVCEQCIVSGDSFDSTNNELTLSHEFIQSNYVLNLVHSVPQAIPNFYSSRAPPQVS